MRIVDLFAGIGGLRTGTLRGLSKMGHVPQVVFTSEIKKAAVTVLEDNYPNEVVSGDITQISADEIPAHDMLLAGFPCQAFSFAGKRLGFADATKGTLFFDVVRILKKHKPAYFVLENVEGLIQHDPDPLNRDAFYGRTMATILETLQELGYNVSWKLLTATNFGVPQLRKRVFIVGSLFHKVNIETLKTVISPSLSSILENNVQETNPEVLRFSALLKKEFGTLDNLEGKIFRDWRGGERNLHSWNFNFKGETSAQERALLEAVMLNSKKKEWISPGSKLVGEGSFLSAEQISTFFVGLTLDQLVVALDKLTEQRYLKKVDHRYKISSGKLTMPISHILDTSGYANTIVATDADRLAVLDHGELRRFTDTEMKRLFGFPDDFLLNPSLSKSKRYDLFGNSVVIPVAEAVVEALVDPAH